MGNAVQRSAAAFTIVLVLATLLWGSLLLAPSIVLGESESGSLLWSADHESRDFDEWWQPGGTDHCGGVFNSGTGDAAVRSTVSRQGSHAARLRITDTTSSQQGARLFRWCEAREYDALYYSAWYYIPRRVTVSHWWLLMEWKSAGSFNHKFGLGVGNRADGEMFVFLERGLDSGGGRWLQSQKDIPVGRWFQLEVYYKKATDETGQVTVWQDGLKIIDLASVQTANSSDLGWAIVNYGDRLDPPDVTVFADAAAISTRRVGPHVRGASPSRIIYLPLNRGSH